MSRRAQIEAVSWERRLSPFVRLLEAAEALELLRPRLLVARQRYRYVLLLERLGASNQTMAREAVQTEVRGSKSGHDSAQSTWLELLTEKRWARRALRYHAREVVDVLRG